MDDGGVCAADDGARGDEQDAYQITLPGAFRTRVGRAGEVIGNKQSVSSLTRNRQWNFLVILPGLG